jgi:hypothetical protein
LYLSFPRKCWEEESWFWVLQILAISA